jgi:hypothetical protein
LLIDDRLHLHDVLVLSCRGLRLRAAYLCRRAHHDPERRKWGLAATLELLSGYAWEILHRISRLFTDRHRLLAESCQSRIRFVARKMVIRTAQKLWVARRAPGVSTVELRGPQILQLIRLEFSNGERWIQRVLACNQLALDGIAAWRPRGELPMYLIRRLVRLLLRAWDNPKTWPA